MDLFKGYVRTINKKCTDSYKDTEKLLTKREADKCTEYAGILARETILIDIDDKKQSEKLMQIVEDMELRCKVVKTTRGMHFYFKNKKVEKCYTGVKLACGLTADIKVGCKNSYAILKFGGKVRQCKWDILKGEEYEELPIWLFPVKTDLDFYNMGEGDGRNQSLFNYILTLNTLGFSKAEARKCIGIINKYIFDVPLTDKEIETICRDEAFPRDTFFEKNRFLHDKFGEYLIAEYQLKRIEGEICYFTKGAYRSASDCVLENLMLRHLPALKIRDKKEVLSYVEAKLKDNVIVTPPEYIAFRNGVYNLQDKTLYTYSSDYAIRNFINWNYNAKAYCNVTDKTLNKLACNDKKVRALLEEAIGYGMYRSNLFGKAFFLTGATSNGKSTFLEMLNTLYGEDNVTNFDLCQIAERFSTALINGKLANIGDDISSKVITMDGNSIFKKIVTCNTLKGEFKGGKPFFFKPYCKLFFSANELPRFIGSSDALLRRLVIIPFNATFSSKDKDYDPFIVDKLKTDESMEYLVRIGIEGLHRVVESNGVFTLPNSVKEALDDFLLQNDSVTAFIKKYGSENFIDTNTDESYAAYKEFCEIENISKECKQTFSNRVCERLRLKTVSLRLPNNKFGRKFVSKANNA